MHIAEGIAPLPLAAAGFALAAGGLAIGLRQLRDETIPRAALVCAAIFVASTLIRLPLGASSVHPVLNGLAGLLLGWAAVPVFVVSLLLQALLFQFGGLSTLGINTVTMAAPALLAHYVFRRPLAHCASAAGAARIGAGATAAALALAFALWAGALVLSGRHFATVAGLALVPHLGLMAVESIFAGFLVSFLWRVKRDALVDPAPTRPGGSP